MKILVIEDEKEVANSVCEYLGENGFSCEFAYDADIAVEKLESKAYACIILDITLPGGNGLDILKHLRQIGNSDGVLIISARNSVDDKVRGLQKGADDYLAKPFHLSELLARVEAIIRRKFFDGTSVIRFEALVIDPVSKSIRYNDLEINLTKKEYELFLYLVSNKNRVVTKEAITEHLYGDEIDAHEDFDFLYSQIKNLRKKLSKAGAPDYIKALYGMGYKFQVK